MDTITSLARSPTSLTNLLSASADGEVRLWDLATRCCRAMLPGHAGAVRGVAFTADGGSAVTCGDDQMVRLWRLPPPGVSLATPEEAAEQEEEDEEEGGGRQARRTRRRRAVAGGGDGV